MTHIHSEYLSELFSTTLRKQVVKKFKELCKEVNFDAIVVSGTSGLVMGGILAHACNKQLIVVRKPKETTHTNLLVEGEFNPASKGPTKCLFVDDFITTGATVARVFEAMKSMKYHQYEWVGVFLWKSVPVSPRFTTRDLLKSYTAIPEYHFYPEPTGRHGWTVYKPEPKET